MSFDDGKKFEQDRIVKLLEDNALKIAEAYNSGLRLLVVTAIIDLIREGE